MDLKLLKCSSMRNLLVGDLSLANHSEKGRAMEQCFLPRTPSLYCEGDGGVYLAMRWVPGIQRSLAQEGDEEEDFGFWEFEYYTGLALMQAVGGVGWGGWGGWEDEENGPVRTPAGKRAKIPRPACPDCAD
eukprot:746135-Hanusia_phi.AAC.4